jgi:4a-hydroxytetrahydrobiopterin dehydratase
VTRSSAQGWFVPAGALDGTRRGGTVRHATSPPGRLAPDAVGWYPCSMDILEDAAIDAGLRHLQGWRRDGDAIVRQLRFDSFRAAIDFIVRVADAADAADHHPELTNVYWNVGVRLTTHDAGGVTQRDLDLARAIDAAAGVGI